MEKVAYYKNWWILVGVPILSILATLIGTPHTIFDPILYIKMGLNLAIVGFIWLLAVLFIFWLDKRMPWETAPHQRRWVIQLGIFIPVGVLIQIVSVQLRNQIIEWPFSWHLFLYTDFPIQVFFTVLLFYMYQKAYLSFYEAKQEEREKIALDSASKPYNLKRGKKTYLIPQEEIAYFFRQDQFNYLKKKNGEEFMLDVSLNAIEQEVDMQAFFRINRQLLAHRQSIISFKVLPNRQMELTLKPHLNPLPLLNKNRSAQFKQWLTSSS